MKRKRSGDQAAPGSCGQQGSGLRSVHPGLSPTVGQECCNIGQEIPATLWSYCKVLETWSFIGLNSRVPSEASSPLPSGQGNGANTPAAARRGDLALSPHHFCTRCEPTLTRRCAGRGAGAQPGVIIRCPRVRTVELKVVCQRALKPMTLLKKRAASGWRVHWYCRSVRKDGPPGPA